MGEDFLTGMGTIEGVAPAAAPLAHAALLSALGLAIVLAYIAIVWRSLRQDWEPVMGKPVTRPAGLSAPTLRYVRSGRFDAASLTSAFLAVAAKGAVTVEQDRKAVRLRKMAAPRVSLTRSESAFLKGLMRPRSTLLLNQNAVHAVTGAAAALQNGVIAEWQGYQAGRLRRRMIPAVFGALAIIIAAAPLADQPTEYALKTLGLGIALIVFGRLIGRVRRSIHRYWQDPWMRTVTLIIDAIAMLACIGSSWMLVFWNGLDGDGYAALFGAVALALPFWAHSIFCASRRLSGPLRGRLDALRNQLLGKSQGIDEIGAAAPSYETQASASVARTLWLADAIGLDAVGDHPAAPVAGISNLFEDPERIADTLRGFVPFDRDDERAATGASA